MTCNIAPVYLAKMKKKILSGITLQWCHTIATEHPGNRARSYTSGKQARWNIPGAGAGSKWRRLLQHISKYKYILTLRPEILLIIYAKATVICTYSKLQECLPQPHL